MSRTREVRRGNAAVVRSTPDPAAHAHRTAAEKFGLTPLSECRHPYGMARRYEDFPGRTQRIAGDTELLVKLDGMCAAAGGNVRPTVGELGERRLQAVVAEVENLASEDPKGYGGWRLSGDADQPIVERLDLHFADAQAAWLRWRTAMEEDSLRRVGATDAR